MKPPVDVVIVAYGSEDLIVRAIGSVSALEAVASLTVVDNGDGRSALAARERGAQVRHRPDNPGFGTGQNEGVALGSAPFVLLLNPDAVMVEGALAAGLSAMSDPTIGAAQGVVLSDETAAPERTAGVELGPYHLLGRATGAKALLTNAVVRRLARRLPMFEDHVERTPSADRDVESLAAVALLVRREAFEAIGGFDERYFLYGEDLDLSRRLRAAGWRLRSLIHPWATHHSGASASGWWDRELRWWEGTMRFAAQWWGTGSFSGALASAFVMWLRLAARRPKAAGDAARALLLAPIRQRGGG